MKEDKVVVKLENFSKRYGKKEIIKNLDLEVYEGEFLTLLGSSGCGKTTILRSISGLDTPSEGRIYLDGVDVTDVEPQKRHVNTIFQNYALFPLLTVKENVSFGLKMQGIPKNEIETRVNKMIKLVHLEGYENRKPKELSGGEQQRVSIIRGLINNPRVLLLDEPLSALDLKLRKQMHVELKHLQRKLGITFIYVTHDQDEALSMSDRIVVLNQGKIEQIGTPEEVYEHPKTLYVANFLGDANIFKGEVTKSGDKSEIKTTDGLVLTLNRTIEKGRKVNLIVRPENTRLTTNDKDTNCIKGKVTDIIYDGYFTKIMIESNDKIYKSFILGNDNKYKENDEVYIYWALTDMTVIESK